MQHHVTYRKIFWSLMQIFSTFIHSFAGFNFTGSDIIEQVWYSSLLLPGPSWHFLTHAGVTASIEYRVRVICAPFYYNTTCTRLCRPRYDKFGHYDCNEYGDKVCRSGWMGPNCDKGISAYNHLQENLSNSSRWDQIWAFSFFQQFAEKVVTVNMVLVSSQENASE